MAPRRKFQRRSATRNYRKLFLIAAEGCKTEPLYFGIFNSEAASIQVSCIRAKHASSPDKVLARMQKRLDEAGLRKGDEAWLVVDKDQWSDEQLNLLHGWASSDEQFGLALSNPKFEFWLLLHFEDGKGVSTGRQCDAKLARCLPNYDKVFDVRKITEAGVWDAIRRAKKRDCPPCDKWPISTGSTVYRLVERIQKGA